MQTLVIAASKGGVGKTTICTGMAVQAAASGQKVVLIDLDPQHSLEEWFARREVHKNMAMVNGVTDVAAAVEILQDQKVDWILIDTPPSQIGVIEQAVMAASFVLIPTKCSAFDLTAIDPVVEMCQQHRKRFAFIINDAPSPKSPLVKGAAEYLAGDGTVLPIQIGHRASYQRATLRGMSAPEIETTGKSKEEMVALWDAVKRLSERLVA